MMAATTQHRYAIEPQRDLFKGGPEGADGSTCFECCEEAEAENWAVFDDRDGLGCPSPPWIADFPSRAAAEAFVAEREAAAAPASGLELAPGTHLIVGSDFTVAVSSFAQASGLYAQYRGTRPSSEMKDGEIRERGALVARVSYNAKVWPPEPWSPGQAPLYDPYERSEPRTAEAVA